MKGQQSGFVLKPVLLTCIDGTHEVPSTEDSIPAALYLLHILELDRLVKVPVKETILT
jgi:hypothetical protein